MMIIDVVAGETSATTAALTTESGRAACDAIVTFAFTTFPGACAQTAPQTRTNEKTSTTKVFILTFSSM